jgi:hypothetical protein
MKEIQNLLTEKIPKYFGGGGVNKNFDSFIYDTFYISCLNLKRKKEKNNFIGAFCIPNYLLDSEDVKPILKYQRIVRVSITKMIDKVEEFKKNLYDRGKIEFRQLEKPVIIGGIDYTIFYFGFTHSNKKVNHEIALETMKEIRGLCIRNLSSNNPERYLYI